MDLTQVFPRLRREQFEITSPKDPRYNCVAWAAGDVKRWWWPGEAPFSYWPEGIPREESVATFIAGFSSLGYELAASGDLEPALEKVAIFASADGVPTHMARQLPDGSWTSKLGMLDDITHIDVHCVGGSDYGEVVVFLHRPDQ
ncbi:MAG TPA: hypothetical protein VGR02_12760 [Thermoanaerobaculia bacterium]|jgi:hypothetical protein|nr:hypothetical protein [Thermoanaerobaculia bacterium]